METIYFLFFQSLLKIIRVYKNQLRYNVAKIVSSDS